MDVVGLRIKFILVVRVMFDLFLCKFCIVRWMVIREEEYVVLIDRFGFCKFSK